MDLEKKIIGIGGNARSGKDTLANNLVSILAELNIKAEKVSFANALRQSVDDFLLRELGISAFTEDKKEKDIIRPFLVFWGTDIMRGRDEDVWVKKLQSSLKEDQVNIISDLRFTNELDWIQNNNGVSVMLSRPNANPANKYEEEENKKLRQSVNLKFSLADLKKENRDYILKSVSHEILNSLLTEETLDLWKATCPL
jgi:hypothetical protein|tara:strand:- start:1494 stop:2087 length:594 start_codon:yes stop_codon:yes gene_type:complete